jgi:hypothetical protein
VMVGRSTAFPQLSTLGPQNAETHGDIGCDVICTGQFEASAGRMTKCDPSSPGSPQSKASQRLARRRM